MSYNQMGLFSEYPTVEVVRSKRRRKTIEATRSDGILRLTVPHNLSKDEEKYWVREMTEVVQSELINTDEKLARRAGELATRYRLETPKNIRFIPNQKSRWAYCEIDRSEIAICDRVQKFPLWVLDYIIVHELVHLIEPRHNADFWKLTRRYPKAERARGYLDAKAEAEKWESSENL